MANLFQKNAAPLMPRAKAESQYNSARYNLLLVVIFTVINMILALVNANSYFLFSATIPYFLTYFGMYMCGKMPDEIYGDRSEYIFFEDSFLYTVVAVSIVVLALYFLCWLFSGKQRVGWLIAALVLFVLDSIFLVWNYGISVDMLMDYLFHIWVIVLLVIGIKAHYKLKILPPDEDLFRVDLNNEPITDAAPDEFANTFNPADFGETPAEQKNETDAEEGTEE